MVTNATDNSQACIDACKDCAQACYECFDARLQEADLDARGHCLKTLIECGKMCEMSIGMMSMAASIEKEHCELCANICEMCAKECDKFKDDHCIKCADICRMCAEECRKMAGM